MNDQAIGADGPDTSEDGGGPNAKGSFLAVVYDAYQDPAFRPLAGAVEQVEELADTLALQAVLATKAQVPE